MFFCLLFPKKRALFENKTPISRQKRAQDLSYKEGSAGSKSLPAVFMPPTPSKASQTGRRGARGRAPTAMSDRLQRPWVQTVTKQAPGAEASCARRRICFRLGRSMAPASRSLIGATLAVARFLFHTTNTSRKTGVLFYPMAEHDRSIYDADIAKKYDRVSPLAQIQRPREAIKI